MSKDGAAQPQMQALTLAKVMDMDDIAEAVLTFPCPRCGAEAGKPCHVLGSPTRKATTHSPRGAVLWAMWHKGYKAGRERALAEAS